jgi:HlyD family secretion protein
LLTLVSGDETRIQASVDEKNLSYLKLGQTARATADAYPERPFNATLTFIAPAVDAQRGTVDLKLRVDAGVDYLRPDMTVSVEIITAQAASALKLPTDAVRRDANGGAYALVNRDGRVEKVKLVLGLRGVGTTQVLEGLAAGDRVITPTTSAEEGDRVREQAERVPKGNAQPVPGLTQ